MKKWKILGTAVLAVCVSVASPVYANETKLPDGFYVGDFNLGGKTAEEAGEEIGKYIDGLAARRVILDIDGKEADTTAGELGLFWSNAETVEEEMGKLSQGNLVQQYMIAKDVEKENVHIPLEAAVEEAKIQTFVDARSEGTVATPQNASIARVNGAFEITPGIPGKVVDVEATKVVVDEALKTPGTEEIKIEAPVEEKAPEITEEDLASIQDVLGTFSTDFSSSGAARSKNLANGAAKINGHVLMPGEILSGYECMHPFTTSNGYYTAAAYENGQVVDSVGGGVCQIATTLYNTALLAELEIPQRQNHSMIVSYVKPSMDAAIAGTYKDIKIQNNYSTPIYVEGYTEGRTLTFTIYGKETRPENREIQYVSETLGSTDPGAPIQRVDNSLSPGQTKRVQSAHRGLRSRLWKVVTVDGVETERTVLHTDNYNASKAIVLVGPAAPAPAPEPIAPGPEQAEPAPTEAEAIEGINGGPGVTNPAPQAPAPVIEAPAPAPEG